MPLLVAVGSLEDPRRPCATLQERRNHFCDHCGQQVMAIKYDERTEIVTVVPVNTEEEVLLSAFKKESAPIPNHTTPPSPTTPIRPLGPSPSRQRLKQSSTSSIDSYPVPSSCSSLLTPSDESIPALVSRKGSLYCADLLRTTRSCRFPMPSPILAESTGSEDQESDQSVSQGSTDYLSFPSPRSLAPFFAMDPSIRLSPPIDRPDLMEFSSSSSRYVSQSTVQPYSSLRNDSISKDRTEPCICSPPSSPSRESACLNAPGDTDDSHSLDIVMSISSHTTDLPEESVAALSADDLHEKPISSNFVSENMRLSSVHTKLKRPTQISWASRPPLILGKQSMSKPVGGPLSPVDRHFMN